MRALIDAAYQNPEPRFWRWGQITLLVAIAFGFTLWADAPSPILGYSLRIVGCLWAVDVFFAFLYMIAED